MKALTLKYGFKFEDLFETNKLIELLERYCDYYKDSDPESFERYSKFSKTKGEGIYKTEVSKISLIDAGRV
jgi:hypothetical protein